MPPLPTLTLTTEEEIEVKIEEIRREIKCLEDQLAIILKNVAKNYKLIYPFAQNDGLAYPPFVSIEHLQLHIEELNQLIQMANEECEQEKIARRLRSQGHIE